MDDKDEQEYRAAWHEASGEQPADTDAIPDVEPGAGDQDQPAEVAEEAGSEAAEPDEQAQAAGKQPPEQPETNPTDIWTNATPEQKAAFEAASKQAQALEHRLRSDDGRVARFQRERDEARKKLEAVARASEEENIKTYLNSDEFRKVRADYGDEMGPVFNLLEKLADRQERADANFGQINNAREEEAERKAFETLGKAAPDWEAMLGSPDFSPWLAAQPTLFQQAIEENRERLVDPQSVAAVVSRFRVHQHLQNQQQAQPASQPQLDQRREKQLEGARSTKTRQPVVAASADDDYAAFFQQATAKLAKEMAR